jgi:hypothetical protein
LHQIPQSAETDCPQFGLSGHWLSDPVRHPDWLKWSTIQDTSAYDDMATHMIEFYGKLSTMLLITTTVCVHFS